MDTDYRMGRSHFSRVTLDDFLVRKQLADAGRKIFKLDDQGTTTTYGSSTGIATSTPATIGVAGITWFKEIIKYAEDLRMFDQAVMHNEYMVNTGAHEVMIPRTTSHLDITTNTTGEGESMHFTDMNNISTTNVTVTNSSYKKGGVSISLESAQNSMVDLVTQARYVIMQAMAKDLDTDIATELQDSTVTNRVFGDSSATDPSGLGTGDIMTTDLVADAMSKIEENNFVPKMLFMAPQQLKAFRKDSQFTNAAEYGGNEVVLKGEVGRYLGLRIITTTQTPAFASGATDTNQSSYTWGATGHTCVMVGTNQANQLVSGVVGWKMKPQVDYEWHKMNSAHHVFYRQCYKAKILEPKAVCLIKVSDA